MSNPNGRRGATWEAQVVAYLKDNGFPAAERRVRGGSNDRGDIAGIPNVVIEAKNTKVIDLPGFLREAETECVNDNAALGIVFIKARGKAVDRGYAVVDIETMTQILRVLVNGETW